MNLEQLRENIENDSNLKKYLRGVGKKVTILNVLFLKIING